eukprot:TRINITY_DN1517_c0_g1_i2.p1 TRINITY_DN1517_c0_g1~~TRINITY_DN1517_c0_g1_i2.p1  ORF type:complete len:380 (+),score=64.08 TRINITY_DN1517_c0_g1_i2:148-1140(+)
MAERGGGANSVDLPGPYRQSDEHHDGVPSPWRLQYAASNFGGHLPVDMRRQGFQMYNLNLKMFMKPATMSNNPTARDAVLRALDPSRHMRGNDSGLGRTGMRRKFKEDGNANDQDQEHHAHVPSHIFALAKQNIETHQDLVNALIRDETESFAVKRLYELCEEKEIVWSWGQRDPNVDRNDGASGDHGRFPHVDEQANLVDELKLDAILKLRHKTNGRRRQKWTEIQYEFKRRHQQYLRRRHILQDEMKARLGVLKEGSHCCRFPLDELGDEVTYNSSTCYGNHYFKCPEEKCRDVPAQMPASAAVWVSSAFGLAVACAASAAAPSRSST